MASEAEEEARREECRALARLATACQEAIEPQVVVEGYLESYRREIIHAAFDWYKARNAVYDVVLKEVDEADT